MDIHLWEWYLYVIIVEGLIDTLANEAVADDMCLDRNPYTYFKID